VDKRASRLQEFQVQKPSIANPPTHFLAIRTMISLVQAADPVSSDVTALTAFLHDTLPALERQTRWYLKSQASGWLSSFEFRPVTA